MSNSIIHAGGNKKKIFDPRDSSTGSGGFELVDASIALRGEQWWMYLAGQAHGSGSTDLYSASLPPGEPLSSAGWKLSRGTGEPPSPVAGRKISHAWDGKGGRHCPCYVKGWDPGRREWRERIYYAGGAENLWGPYAIGFLEWDGQIWADRAKPVFTATEDWEHGSVFEPNLIYHDGKWKMWYVAGSNHEDYLAQGYAESDDGISWSQHRMFASPEMRMFDFCVCIHRGEFHAIGKGAADQRRGNGGKGQLEHRVYRLGNGQRQMRHGQCVHRVVHECHAVEQSAAEAAEKSAARRKGQ